MQTNFEQRAKFITERFVSLSNYAEKLAFPDYRKGLFKQKDITGWNPLARYIFNLSHPFATTDKTGGLFYFFWMILFCLQYLASIIALILLYPILFNLTPFFPPIDNEARSILSLVVIAGLPSSVISYAWWLDTLFAKKFSWWIKLALVIAVFWVVKTITAAMIAQSHSPVLWKSSKDTLTILVSFIALLIPSISYFVAVLFDLILAILLLIRTIFGGITSIHTPRPIDLVLKLATGEIQSNKPSELPWKLLTLPKSEINTLRQWAEANREGSEKRTVPAFLIAALFGVLLLSDFIRHILDNYISTLYTNLLSFLRAKSPFAVPIEVSLTALIIFPVFILFGVIVFKNLLALFRNIMAQNLVVEACIVAEYSKQEPETLSSPQKSCLDVILSFFYKIEQSE